MSKTLPFAAELTALTTVLEALEPLDEEKRRFVLGAVVDRLKLTGQSVPIVGGSKPPAPAASPLSMPPIAPPGNETPKQFLKAKRPTSDVQRIACLAYYLTTYRNQPHFKTLDLTKLNTESAATRLSNPAYAVGNATKQSKFLASAGKGKKQITPLGEDIVDALPDQERVRQIVAEQTAGLRKRRKKQAGKRGR